MPTLTEVSNKLARKQHGGAISEEEQKKPSPYKKLIGRTVELGVVQATTGVLVPSAAPGVGQVIGAGLPLMTLTTITKDIGGAVKTHDALHRRSLLSPSSEKGTKRPFIEPPKFAPINLGSISKQSVKVGSVPIKKFDFGNLNLSGGADTHSEIFVTVRNPLKCGSGHKANIGDKVIQRHGTLICSVCGGALRKY